MMPARMPIVKRVTIALADFLQAIQNCVITQIIPPADNDLSFAFDPSLSFELTVDTFGNPYSEM